MAQLGFRSVGIALVLSVIAGCGGRLGVDDGTGDDGGSDTGVADTAIRPDTHDPGDTYFGDTRVDGGSDTIVVTDAPMTIGWRSYTATVTDVKQTWKYGGPPAGSTPPSKGWTGRVDLENGFDLDSGAKAVVLPAYGDGQMLATTAASPMSPTFAVTGGGLVLSVSGTMSGYYYVTDRYQTMTVTLGPDGRPTGGVLKGTSEAFSGDVAFNADTEATVTFVEDTTKPKWKTSSAATFAWTALPWDQRTFEASEPYEVAISPEAWFGSTVDVWQHPIQTYAHGVTKERGIRFELKDWNMTGLTGYWNEVRDFAGNASDKEIAAPSFPGAKVDKRATMTWRADDGGVPAYLWGSAATTTEGCRDGKSCVKIGPFTHSYCTSGSKGGLATRLPGNGTSEAAIRVVAKPAAGSPSTGAPFFTDVVKLRVAIPTGGTVDATSALKWPTTAGSDGSYDTGWTTVSASLGKLDAETGIAISGGGLGPDGGTGCGFIGGPPRPMDYDVTVYVEQVTLYGVK
jgi:hypothetical protein